MRGQVPTERWSARRGDSPKRRRVQPARGGTVLEYVVELDGRVDEAWVHEGLGEVPELFAGGADLLAVEVEVG
jgi:hypothetical protein